MIKCIGVHRNSQMTRENQRLFKSSIVIRNYTKSELLSLPTLFLVFNLLTFKPGFLEGNYGSYASIFKKSTVPIAHIRTDSEPIATRSL